MSVTDGERKWAEEDSRDRFRRDMLQFERELREKVTIAREEGKALGRLIGEIEVYEFRLSLSRTPVEELEKLSLDELRRLADELRQRVSSPS